MSSDVKHTYYFHNMPIAEFRLSNHKKSAVLIPPFDVIIAGLHNSLFVDLEIYKPETEDIFGVETIGDIKNFIFGKDTLVIK